MKNSANKQVINQEKITALVFGNSVYVETVQL